ncbi:MAG: HD domain-containing protein [Anaerolineae bacterium]|nr:HD domain-containing protein [Anaerolineae bacterium]
MVILNRIRYRVGQFFQTLWAAFLPVDREYAAQKLTPALLALFETLSHAEQQHSITLCKGLEAQGAPSPDLLVAALLHDVGKTVAPPYLWERVWVVLAGHYTPKLAARLSEGDPRGLRRGFVTHKMHPQWGADLAEKAGANARVVALIRKHHAPPGGDAELAKLQVIDDGV